MDVMLKGVTRRIKGITHTAVTVRILVTGAALTTDFLLDSSVKIQ